MKEIILHDGSKCLVDNADHAILGKHKWRCQKNKHTKYAYRIWTYEYKKRKCIWMHREILGISNEANLRADHIDHNGLNNQRKNLRIATHEQNNCYKRSAKNGTSKYLGVSFCSQTQKWRATITKGYRQVSLGRHDSEKEAAVAYNNAAKKLHGDFANLNVVK